MDVKETDTFYPKTRLAWRRWLEKNHLKKKSVWIIHYKKAAGKPTLSWSDAVDEALCFGWIDGIRKSIDHERFVQYFSVRKPTSTWSKINKDKIDRLLKEGLIMQAGLDAIETAKKNKSWSSLDKVDKLTIPKDLNLAFRSNAGSKAYFTKLSRSKKRVMLYWLLSAKTDVTRLKRIDHIIKAVTPE